MKLTHNNQHNCINTHAVPFKYLLSLLKKTLENYQ